MAVLIKITGSGNGVLKSIAESIGEPATPKDKKERLAEIIDNAQKDIASLCNEKGCNIPVHPTFPEIVSGLNKVTHFLQSVQISGLSAQVGFSEPGKMILSWKNPISDQNYSGVMIRYKAGSYPASQTDGTLIYDSNGTLPASETATVTRLSDGTAYYVRGFAYAISGSSRIYTTSTTGAQCTAIPRQLKGQQVFTASSIFTVPYGVTSVDVFLVGGGAGGKTGINGNGGGGGGSGYTKTIKSISVSPGQSISVIVGAGGAGGKSGLHPTVPASGGATSFGAAAAAEGGTNPNPDWQRTKEGGDGGSGGGGQGNSYAENGGSDGGDGDGIYSGQGQHTTTRAFGESSNTLYAGGGGGGVSYIYEGARYKSLGGAGGGGAGGYYNVGTGVPPEPGTPNTGGGGGGGDGYKTYTDGYYERYGGSGAVGGSGIAIVRWGY